MTRINVYDRNGTGELLGWFNDDSCTEEINEDTFWDGNNHRGMMSGLQIGFEKLMRTAQGRWVRHYDGHNEFNGPVFYEFLTDDEARAWLLKNKDDEIVEKYFGELEEETGPQGGRPTVGPPISVAYPRDLLARIDAAADKAEISRAAWLRQAAENAL